MGGTGSSHQQNVIFNQAELNLECDKLLLTQLKKAKEKNKHRHHQFDIYEPGRPMWATSNYSMELRFLSDDLSDFVEKSKSSTQIDLPHPVREYKSIDMKTMMLCSPEKVGVTVVNRPVTVRRLLVTNNFTIDFQTTTTLFYYIDLKHGKELVPNETWIFKVPEGKLDRKLRHITLVHRKDAKYFTENSMNSWDTHGAYNQIRVRNALTKKWTLWKDPEKNGKKSFFKFAEFRQDDRPEHEDLNDWQKYFDGPIDFILIANISNPHPLSIGNVHELRVEFLPEKEMVSSNEEIFTAGCSFVDYSKGVLSPSYGGGYCWQKDYKANPSILGRGLYPNAIEIPTYGAKNYVKQAINSNMFVDELGALRIRLEVGRIFTCFEISVGDTYLDPEEPIDSQFNKDSHIGRCGWSKLWVKVQNLAVKEQLNTELYSEVDKSSKYFMREVNVPPAGVMSGGPLLCGEEEEEEEEGAFGVEIKDGDYLIIEARLHPCWMMAYRIQYV